MVRYSVLLNRSLCTKHAHPDDPNICKNDCLTRPSFLQLAQLNDTDHLKKDTVPKTVPFFQASPSG